MPLLSRYCLAALCCWSFAAIGSAVAGVVPQETTAMDRPSAFGTLIEGLSEPGGDFGGDNLISNEQSYLRVLPDLAASAVHGGAYVGGGPDQNFTYIAQVRPEIAYLIDIRRDNLLLLLLFKAIFAEAPTRIEYLCLLTGRQPPDKPATWNSAAIGAMIDYVDHAPLLTADEEQQLQRRLDRRLRDFDYPLAPSDLKTIANCRRAFVAEGLSLVFQAQGQPRRSYYPTFRTLLQETDGQGHQRSFLADEAAYQFVRTLQQKDQIVPVVGDVAGPKAMRAVADDIKRRNLVLSAFYISNVEYYLFPDKGFDRYAANLRQFPFDAKTTIIRSEFPSGGSRRMPQYVPGSYSASAVQPFARMIGDLDAGRYRRYADIVTAMAQQKTAAPHPTKEPDPTAR